MPSPQGQSYITVQELKSLGLSAQFANSPLLTQPSITAPWVPDTIFAANSLITPIGWTTTQVLGPGSLTDVTPSGIPDQVQPVDFQVVMSSDGALGVATFVYSFDGGATFSPDYLTAASVALVGTGIVIEFDNVTFTNGTIYSATYEDNGFFYSNPKMGTTGSVQPSFPIQQGQIVDDNDIEWVCQGENTVANLCIIAASEYADGYLRSKFGLSWPIVAWGFDLKLAVAQVAAYHVARIRGYNPALPAEDAYRISYEQATKWLKDVASGTITPDVTTSQSVAPGAPDPQLSPVVGSPAFAPRVWTRGTRGTKWR